MLQGLATLQHNLISMGMIRAQQRLIGLGLLFLIWGFCSGAIAPSAEALPLSDRLQQFPHWTDKPPVKPAVGDLVYPEGFLGTWRVTTTLTDMAAPLAPDIVTPGYEGNRTYLNQPVTFEARFVRPSDGQATLVPLPAAPLQVVPLTRRIPPVVADRAFNGLNLARAYLNQSADGTGSVIQQVKVDPDNPNRQVTLLRGDRQLEATITGRAVEVPAADTFVTSEVFQQVFRGVPQPYLNEVESTTAYTCEGDCSGLDDSLAPATAPATITADQATAIYLSPQDPDFFAAGSRPVALYRYDMRFERLP